MCNTKFRRGTPGGTQAVGWRAEVVAPHGLVDTQASGRTHRCAPTDGCRNCPDISAAWHRRRPGGPGWYSVAMIRACGVIDAGRPRRGSACDGHKKGTGRGCTPGSCLLCTACRRHEPPYWGAQGGRSPPALLSPHFFGKKWGPRPGRPVPRGAPRCENVEPLIRPSVRTGAPSPCGGKASGGGYPPLRARRLIRAPGSYPRAPSLAPLGQFTLSRATAGGAGAAALGGPFRLAGSRTARQGCRALLPGNRGRSQIPSFWGILGRESKPFCSSSSVGMESLILPLR